MCRGLRRAEQALCSVFWQAYTLAGIISFGVKLADAANMPVAVSVLSQVGDVNANTHIYTLDTSTGQLTLMTSFTFPSLPQASYRRTAFAAIAYPGFQGLGESAVAIVQVCEHQACSMCMCACNKCVHVSDRCTGGWCVPGAVSHVLCVTPHSAAEVTAAGKCTLDWHTYVHVSCLLCCVTWCVQVSSGHYPGLGMHCTVWVQLYALTLGAATQSDGTALQPVAVGTPVCASVAVGVNQVRHDLLLSHPRSYARYLGIAHISPALYLSCAFACTLRCACKACISCPPMRPHTGTCGSYQSPKALQVSG